MISGQTHAQEWQTYTYPDPGFAIQFPGVPDVQTSRIKNSVGLSLPVTRYIVRQDGVQYTLSVVNYSSTNADALTTIGETARSFSAKGKVSADAGARVNGNHGRELTLTESDGSRSDIAIFFVNKHLYTAVGQALPPNRAERSADTTRFQESLQFPDDDSGFFGLFAGRGKTSSNAALISSAASSSGAPLSPAAASSPVTVGSSSGNRVSPGTGGSGKPREHLGTTPIQRADAACFGKSAGDLVQLDTPTGPVAATCTLTARPNPASGNAAPPN